jgi:hypothetical protein
MREARDVHHSLRGSEKATLVEAAWDRHCGLNLSLAVPVPYSRRPRIAGFYRQPFPRRERRPMSTNP